MENNEDTFELSFRLLGNEIIGMKISSQSKVKNWAFFGLISLVAITILVTNVGPPLLALIGSM